MSALDATSGKKQLAAGKRNMVAMAHLTMALGTEAFLNKVSSAITNKWPGGLIYVLIDNLKKQYHPKDRVAGVEMKQKMNAIKMGKKTKPSKLFEQIKSIEN
eukprot:8823597-Ditylum_brightwellii.AAC.1